MNERIKEIAQQCYQIEDPHGRFPREVFNQEKFAELIVKECAKIADVADENKCEWIGGNILTHFGVEE